MKVLILAYDFPPLVSVGGLRPYSWFRYLGEFGVEPVIVTRQWANTYGDERDYIAPSATDKVVVEDSDLGTVVRTPYAPNLSHRLLLEGGPDRWPLVRKAVTAWYEIGQYYATVGPKKELYRAARRYLADHRVDAMVATGEPFVLFGYAARLSREFGIPWVADYRDPWSQDRLRAPTRISRAWAAGLERRTTESASAVTTVSESVKDVLALLHRNKPIEVIPNGYDPEAMDGLGDSPQASETLTIAFVGSIYAWHPVESVFRVFDDFVQRHAGAGLALKMVGVGDMDAREQWLRGRFPALAENVTFIRRLPNREMAVELAKANAFLLLNNYSFAGTKVYDYLALERTILLCYSDDPEAEALREKHYKLKPLPGSETRVLQRMVEETRSGVVVRDAAHLSEVLTGLHREFTENGSVACTPVGTERYSRRAQAGRLAHLVKGLG